MKKVRTTESEYFNYSKTKFLTELTAQKKWFPRQIRLSLHKCSFPNSRLFDSPLNFFYMFFWVYLFLNAKFAKSSDCHVLEMLEIPGGKTAKAQEATVVTLQKFMKWLHEIFYMYRDGCL